MNLRTLAGACALLTLAASAPGAVLAVNDIQAATLLSPRGIVPDRQSKICGHEAWKYVDDGEMILRNDTFADTARATRRNPQGVGDTECLYNRNDGGNFTITKSRQIKYTWNAYPSLYDGCWYSVCSKGTLLPMRVSDIHRLTMDLWTRYPASTVGNDATDWWFSTSMKRARAGLHPNAAELMMWFDWSPRLGGPVPGQANYRNPRVPDYYRTIGGVLWWIWTYRTTQQTPGGTTSWQYIQARRIGVWHRRGGRTYLRNPRHPSLTNFNVMPLLDYCIRHGWISRSDVATSWPAGNEIVRGGVGIRLLRYTQMINGVLQG